MPDNIQTPDASIGAGEVVLRGTPVTLSTRVQLTDDAARSVAVLGHRAPVALQDDLKTIQVDTATLPVGRHVIRAEDLLGRRGAAVAGLDLDFVLVDSKAPVPANLALRQATRFHIGDLEADPLPMEGIPAGEYLDVFKAEDRTSGAPVQLAYDEQGQEVDLDERLAGLQRRRFAAFGKLHPDLHAVLQEDHSEVPVAIWFAVDADEPAEKSERRATARRPKAEAAAAARWREQSQDLVGVAEQIGVRVSGVDEHAPVVYGVLEADVASRLSDVDRVQAVFLHSTEGIEDLVDSEAIANSDDAHTAGFTGSGIRVAVYEDGPDDTTNLSIAGRFTNSPTPSQHARHTHGIVKNVQANAPHGHAPDCTLFSANSMDLAAIRWAAQEQGCTVISQSFHRGPEQTSGTLSFDDVYKDWLALRWPYPTICEAAGNGEDDEFVNHKGYNRITVGNHNDTASAMASDTCFRNPTSPHGDRELPEISANGTGVTTVGLTMSGTSMAAPAVAGAVACVQQVNGTLRSWPEGCRAILMAGAWRNPSGGTWRSDLISGVDSSDGSGALDTMAAVNIAKNRSSRNAAGKSRGWDVGTSRRSESDGSGFATYVYRVTVPRFTFVPHVKVALAWDSKVSTLNLFGLDLPLSSSLTVDLDLHVRDAAGRTVATSSSWDNSYEIAEFAGQRGATYDIVIRRWSGNDDVWFGIAWNVTGVDILSDRIQAANSAVIGALGRG